MGVASTNSSSGLPGWLIRLCRWLWGKRGFVWTTVLLNLLLGIIVTLLFTDPSALTKLPIGWAFQNTAIIILIFVVLLSFTIIVGAVSQIPVGVSAKKLKQLYLQRMAQDTETLTLTGIPAGLMPQGVPLDEVFIPVKFKPHRPLSDYGLTEAERRHYLDLQQRGLLSEEMERAVFEAEKDHQYHLKNIDRISIADLWERLTRDRPAVVIQGVPGIGKSTCMERLTLHMARCGLHRPDPTMPDAEDLKPALVPIFLRLGRYATARTQIPDLSLEDYLKQVLTKLGISGVDTVVLECLKAGDCLVMLDGLDEVSDPRVRKQVQEAIREFIASHRHSSGGNFNRFLITSRVAGYDQEAFPT